MGDPSEADLICEPYDFEAILPLELVREHTNTDDVEHFSDSLLKLYRKTALSTAERYTGLLLMGRKTITEIVNIPNQITAHNTYASQYGYGYPGAYHEERAPMHLHETKYGFAQDFAFYYGTAGRFNRRVTVTPGTNQVELPIIYSPFGLGRCDPHEPSVSRLMYVAGFADECDMPPEIAMGALKYIAHAVENAGDVPTVVNSQGGQASNNTLLNQASNPALASGALDIWANVRVSV